MGYFPIWYEKHWIKGYQAMYTSKERRRAARRRHEWSCGAITALHNSFVSLFLTTLYLQWLHIICCCSSSRSTVVSVTNPSESRQTEFFNCFSGSCRRFSLCDFSSFCGCCSISGWVFFDFRWVIISVETRRREDSCWISVFRWRC